MILSGSSGRPRWSMKKSQRSGEEEDGRSGRGDSVVRMDSAQ